MHVCRAHSKAEGNVDFTPPLCTLPSLRHSELRQRVALDICLIQSLADVEKTLQNNQYDIGNALSDLGVTMCIHFPKENHLLSSACVL